MIQPRSKSDAAARPDSSFAMVHAARRTHKTRNIVMVSCKQLGMIFKGLTARQIAEHGADSLLPDRKGPIDPPLTRRLLQIKAVGPRAVDWASPLFLSIAVAFTLAGAAGFRKAEAALPSSTALDDRRLRRSSLLWRLGGAVVADPSPAQIEAMVPGRDMPSSSRRLPRTTPTAQRSAPIPSTCGTRPQTRRTRPHASVISSLPCRVEAQRAGPTLC